MVTMRAHDGGLVLSHHVDIGPVEADDFRADLVSGEQIGGARVFLFHGFYWWLMNF